MAAPGEFFPIQFAMGVLSLQAQQREAAARTQQLREAQQQQAALEAQRQQLAAVGQAQQARHQAFAESQAETQAELAKQKFAFEIKQHEEMLQNQDARALADLAAGKTAFIRAGAKQPPPEALEGPEVDINGKKRPAFRMARLDLPGTGTLYHPIESAELQEKFDDLEARQQERVSASILKLQQARYQKQRADNFDDRVNFWHQQKLTSEETDMARKAINDQAAAARTLAQQLNREGQATGDQNKIARAAALLADPWAEANENERQRGDEWKAILEAGQRKIRQGLLGKPAQEKSLTGTHPDEIQAQVDKLTTLLTPGSSQQSRESRLTGAGWIERPVYIGADGKIVYPELRQSSSRPPEGYQQGTFRSLYDEKGQVIGTETRSARGEVLTATGKSPFVGNNTLDRMKGAAGGLLTKFLSPAAESAPPASATDIDKKIREANEAFKAGRIDRATFARIAAEVGVK